MAEFRDERGIRIEHMEPEEIPEAGTKGGAVMSAPAATAPVERAETLDWSAAVWAGIISGAVFMMLEMFMVWAFLGMSPWAPPRMIAAMVMGREVLPPPATFAFGIMMAAMVVHFVFAVLFALPVAWLAKRFDMGTAALIGAAAGLALYLLNFHLIAGALGVFPWFTNAQNWVSVFAHIVFGLVAALAYKGLARAETERV